MNRRNGGIALLCLLVACTSPDHDSMPSTFTVGGTVDAFTGVLALLINGGDDLVLDQSGSFTFRTALADGADYEVTVLQQPQGQACVVQNGSGRISGHDVTDVRIVCPLRVIGTRPIDGTSDVAVNEPLQIHFSKPINTETVTVQPAFGPCDLVTNKTLLISADGFTTCAGGTLDFTGNPNVVFRPAGGLFGIATYKVHVTSGVKDVNGVPISAEYLHQDGFSTVAPPCTAHNDPIKFGWDTGASCLETQDASYVSNGDGTVTDVVNNLLWTECSLGVGGSPKTDVNGACELPISVDRFSWRDALDACEALELAGRSDWTLPDYSRLETLYLAGRSPPISSSFPATASDNYWSKSLNTSTSIDDARTVRFNITPGFIGSLNYVRCVSTGQTGRPQMKRLFINGTTGTSIELGYPFFATRGYPTGGPRAYIGLDGDITVSGTNVFGATQGPIDIFTGGTLFSGLTSLTDYRIVVVAENSAGYDVQELVVSTGPRAPVLAPLVASTYSETVTIESPTFDVVGSPAPTVQAYFGRGDTIGFDNATETVTGYLLGPIDVASQGETFTNLTTDTAYRIFVVARNVEGYDVKAITKTTGAFRDNGDGTAYMPSRDLTWARCAQGSAGSSFESWQSCRLNLGLVWDGFRFCISDDPSTCDDGTVLTGEGDSPAYDTCASETIGGRSDWRLPTKDELMSLFDTDWNEDGLQQHDIYYARINRDIFPGYQAKNFWSASVASVLQSWIVRFNPDVTAVDPDPGAHLEYKVWFAGVRCVADGP